MIPEKTNLFWILQGGGKHDYRWLFRGGYQLFVNISQNQRQGIVENWLSSGQLLRKSLKAVGLNNNQEKQKQYII